MEISWRKKSSGASPRRKVGVNKEVGLNREAEICTVDLTYLNTLGPSLVQICEKFGYEKTMQFLLDSV